ncbi:unnamed protein product, partial [marine sediment metagenome]
CIFDKHRVAPAWGPEQEAEYGPLAFDGYLATWKGSPFLTYPENWNAGSSYLDTTELAMTLTNHDY